MHNSDIQRRLIFLLKTLGVAALYALLIYMDRRYFESGTAVSSFEAASGFALAVLLIGGKQYAWGVLLGATLINVTTAPFWSAVAISSSHALEAFCSTWLLTRDAKFDQAIRSLRDYLRLILLGGGVGVSIGALTGVAALLVLGFFTPEIYFQELLHWWTGDMLGVILITPLMLVCWQAKNDWPGAKWVVEAALLLGLTFLAGQIVFLGWFHDSFGHVARGYVMFMFIAWVAVRLGTLGTVVALNMTAAQALLGAYFGVGFFSDDISQTQLTNYWFYMATLSVIGMALATYFAEHELNKEILRRSETRLRTIYESTSDAVMLLDGKGFFDCNKATLAMFGYATHEEFCSKHPVDLSPPKQPCGTDSMTLANRQIATAIENGSNYFEWVHRRADTGKIFTADVLLNSMELDGKTVLQATVRDITERKQTEEVLKRHKQVLDTTNDGFWMVDAAGNLQMANQAYTNISGYSVEELMHMHISQLEAKEESEEEVNAHIKKIIAQGSDQFEIRHRHKDGHEIDMEVSTIFIREIGQFAGFMRDITERKQNEMKIIRLSQIYRLLSRVNEAIIHTQDRNELFAALCNAAIESGLFRFVWIGMLDEQKLSVIPVVYAGTEEGYTDKLNIRLDDEHTGYGPTGRAIREDVHIICHDIENDPSMALWRDAALKRGYRSSGVFPIREGGCVAGTINAYAADAHFFTPDIIQLMLELASDVSFSFDVLAEKKRRERAEDETRRINVELEHRVLERTRQLEDANKELEAFSYSVSHDLRAPLRSIDGFSRVLSKKYYAQLDATGKDWLERVCRASQHMGHLIDDILQLSLVARGPLNRELVDLSGIAENVANDLNKTNPGRHVQFTLQQGLSVQADPGLLRIVMDNLLGNAYKFTSKKTRAEIEFGTCDINGESAFFVRDNGDGFNMDYVRKLFGAFQRLHTMDEFEGTGIGLATVQRVIHRHNGRVWAEGKEGQGATFYFTLPQREREA